MKTKHFSLLTAALALFISYTTVSWAQEELTTSVDKSTPSADPKWKAESQTYYYDFQGTRASEKAPYNFQNATLGMQLFALQYKATPNWTLQALTQYLDNYVETEIFGGTVQDRTRGLGDTWLTGFTPLYATSEYLVLGHIGVSVPTGNINFKNTNANDPDARLAYNMQSGSGTFDTVTGLTSMTFQGPVQAGTHLTGIFRNGRNGNGYALGNLYRADAWVDYNTTWGLTPRLVGYYKHKDPVQGYDEKYERGREVYAPYYEFYHHNQINWDLSAALKYTQKLGPVAVSAEVGKPLAQNNINYDNAAVFTEYYGNLNVSGNF